MNQDSVKRHVRGWIRGSIVIVLATALIASIAVLSGDVHAAPALDNNEINGGSPQLTIVQISDLRIGNGIDDYGSGAGACGWDDSILDENGEPAFEDNTAAAENLRDAVSWINANSRDIDVVLVTGDITQSGERSEFQMAYHILKDIEVPWVPLIGNHDIWGYNSTSQADSPVAVVFYMEVFGGHLDELGGQLLNWDDGTRFDEVYDADSGYSTHFQNYAFDLEGRDGKIYHIICADFNSRTHGMDDPGGVEPWGHTHEFSGGTWPWFTARYGSYDPDGEPRDNVLIFSHHPLTKDQTKGSFLPGDYQEIASFLNDNGRKYHTGLWGAGHSHRGDWYDVKTLDMTSTICPGEETGAMYEDSGHIRRIDVLG